MQPDQPANWAAIAATYDAAIADLHVAIEQQDRLIADNPDSLMLYRQRCDLRPALKWAGEMRDQARHLARAAIREVRR